MTVIKEEYISSDITIHDVLPLSFLKKSMYTGSKGGMRFSMEKAELPDENAPEPAEGEEAVKRTVLLCCVWPEPFARAETEEKLIEKESFPFSTEGIAASVVWLNEKKAGFSERRTVQ